MAYNVYRFLDNKNNVLYVGKTMSRMSKRMDEHRSSPSGHLYGYKGVDVKKIERIQVGSRVEMDMVELYFINLFKPEYNNANKYKEESDLSFLDASKYEWKQYRYYYERELSKKFEENCVTMDYHNTIRKLIRKIISDAKLLDKYEIELGISDEKGSTFLGFIKNEFPNADDVEGIMDKVLGEDRLMKDGKLLEKWSVK